MASYPKERWHHENGFINKYIRPDPDPVFENLYRQFPFEINIGRTLFAELTPGTYLKPHVDVARSASINFPLTGDWQSSPLCFYKNFKKYEYVYNENFPTIINTTILHGVRNLSKQTGYIFSLSVYEDWSSIKQKFL
jgi:hypothetical protein